MMIHFFLAANPFLEAFTNSDWMGKLIFLSLITLSVVCWALLIQKFLLTKQAKTLSTTAYQTFRHHRSSPLSLEFPSSNPLAAIYTVLKKQTLEILNKNRRFTKKEDKEGSFLSPSDIDYVEAHAVSAISQQTKTLEKNLFILSTIVTLSPFLGLLGTVWGILITFSDLQTQTAGSTHQVVLGGLSLALTTTVLGLLIAIPALVGHNYLKNKIQEVQGLMESFANEMLASIELQYRQVDIR